MVPPSAEKRWIRSPGGYIFSSLDQYIGRAVFLSGDLDRKLTRLLQRIVRPSDTVLDIGANIGVVTLWLASLVGPTGRVHAFEPNPDVFHNLTEVIGYNRADNVIAHNCALGMASGSAPLSVPVGNSGRGSITRQFDFASQTYQVRVERLDDLLSDVEPSVIKIDAEGAEPQIIAGAIQLLTKSRPLIVLETNAPAPAKDAVGLLRSIGYRFLAIPPSLFRLRTKLIDSDATYSHDVVAAPSEKMQQLAKSLNTDFLDLEEARGTTN
jgi:FkbM family methyltransferase